MNVVDLFVYNNYDLVVYDTDEVFVIEHLNGESYEYWFTTDEVFSEIGIDVKNK